jgi:putative transposase
MIAAAQSLAEQVGMKPACQALDVPRSTVYRQQQPHREPKPRPRPERALTEQERAAVLLTLNSESFADQAPAQVYSQLLDDGIYLCSPRTMYRILEDADQVRERRDVLRHPQYQRPELLATGPNQVWSWDITKLLGPAKWTYFYLYVLLDIFSRYVVGWLVAHSEAAVLAKRLISETCIKQGIEPDQLTLHADRGAPMTAKTTAQLLADLGVEKSHSRPRVSNDNPYSESHFKTLKYRPEFPTRFGSLSHAEAVCRSLLTWYNREHRHSALAYLTPEDVHHGRAPELLAHRQRALNVAYAKHPERFLAGCPRVPQLPDAVWINPPVKKEDETAQNLVVAH